uniref:Acyl-CoA dehydrogenase/oxidase C-terminal domain-containing protein n=1 Tax=Coccolithus braarudii TaxID=221442 RepID=A0A7S0PVB9_9EUKA|mmetsp:Transcript_15745/g.34153  ORF Transcript_15745/g.34153 Transcript_15745/m.34153 type:complete len:151 (+) Transcript_15745:3-455(+)
MPFGSALERKGLPRAWLAESRMEIDQARLLVLAAAHSMDTRGNKAARQAIAMTKVIVARMGCNVADRAVQIFGGAGVSQDSLVSQAFAGFRILRLADGPDEVHLLQVARLEIRRQQRAREAGETLPDHRAQDKTDARGPPCPSLHMRSAL